MISSAALGQGEKVAWPASGGNGMVPAAHGTPAGIADDGRLSRSQRLQLLADWAQDIVDRQFASDEVAAAEAAIDPADTALLRQVNAAIESIEATPDTSQGVVARLWRRFAGD